MDNHNSFWNRLSPMYERMQVKANRELYELVLEETRAYIDPDKDVLELACGTGNLTRELARNARSWIGTDYAEKMVCKARALSSPLITYEVQDATALTYEDNSFDIVLIANALHLMPEPDKALSEIRRVLRPGGLLLAPTFVFEGKVNMLKIRFLSLFGFPFHYSWNVAEYVDYVAGHGFKVESSKLLKVDMLPECYLVLRK